MPYNRETPCIRIRDPASMGGNGNYSIELTPPPPTTLKYACPIHTISAAFPPIDAGSLILMQGVSLL